MCILVVEDDHLIRLILVEELQDAGFFVKEAETGDQAVGLLGSIDPPLSMLITDIHMPGSLSGMDLAAHVQTHHPGVPIIYTTGRPDALAQLHHLPHREVLVRKPYTPDDVIKQVKSLLEG